MDLSTIARNTSPKEHPTGVAPVAVPAGHYFWSQVSGHYDEDSGVSFGNLLRSVCSIWFNAETNLVSSSIASTAHSAVLIVLPSDDVSETYFDENANVQFVATLKSHVETDSLPNMAGLDRFADLDALILPRVKANDGYVLLFNDGRKRHIWFDFRQSDNRLWGAGDKQTQIREPLKHGLYSRQIERLFAQQSPLQDLLCKQGWYPVLTLFPKPYLDIAKFYAKNQIYEGDQIAVNYFTDQYLDAMYDAWLTSDVFSTRKHLFSEVIGLYQSGHYAASVTLAVTQFSGIIFDVYHDAKDNRIAKYISGAVKESSPHLLRLTVESLARYVKSVFEGPGRKAGAKMPLDRKSIMHGNKVTFTKRDALQAIVLLDCLYYVLKLNQNGNIAAVTDSGCPLRCPE